MSGRTLISLSFLSWVLLTWLLLLNGRRPPTGEGEVQPVAHALQFMAVLTNNAGAGEPAIPTKVSYKADPTFTNPADTSGSRLLDRDLPAADWNTTAGINWVDQTLTFDFGEAYQLGRFELLFDMPAKPGYVDISVCEEQEGPWREVGRMVPEERNGWYQFELEEVRSARFVRMFFKLKEWGWYLREVEIWGRRANEPGPQEALPGEREGDRLVLVREGKPRASIVVGAKGTEKALAAAYDLRECIYKMSGAILPLRSDEGEWDGTLVLVGPSRYLGRASVEVPLGYPENEKVILRTIGSHLVAVGNDEGEFYGTEFAVQMLLERLGAGWFGPEEAWTVAPKKATLMVEPLDIEHSPPFSHRSVWAGLGRRWYLGGVPQNISHAHAALFPPEHYFQEHPEYYALIGGRRVSEGEWQLCTTNPDVIRLTTEKAIQSFNENPEQVMFSLSNNDCGGFCECEACAASGANPGARMLAFANAVARGLRHVHRDRSVVFLAYWYTHAAPKEQMTAEPGVAVMVVNEACHAHALEDPRCPRNVAWVENFKRWAATGARMAIYEWYIPGTSQHHWRRLPWVSGEVAIANLRFWKRQGVDWVTYESQPAYEEGSGYPLRWPLFYVAAKGMWDDSLSAEEILSDACRKLFAGAAEPMLAYYAQLERAMIECPEHGSIWNLPNALAVFTDEVVARLRTHLHEAQRLVEGSDEDTRQRVQGEIDIWARAEKTLEELSAAKAGQ